MLNIVGVVNELALKQNPGVCRQCRSFHPTVEGSGAQICINCAVRNAHNAGRAEQNRTLAEALEKKAWKFRGRYSMVRTVCRQMAAKLRGG
jgi:hypothetical protein